MEQKIQFNDNVGGVSVGRKDGNIIISGDNSDGGYFIGKSHAEDGGIKVVNKETGEPLLVEGGEVIINKRVLAKDEKFVCEGTPKEITSKINEMEGGVSWSETGSCRLVKTAADGTEIEEDATRADEGFGVTYVSGNKTYIVTADTMDQIEIVRDAIRDYKDGFIEKEELENTMQSYMNDEQLLESQVVTISGKPFVYDQFYAGYIQLIDAEPINIDESTAIEFKDGGPLCNIEVKAAFGFMVNESDPREISNKLKEMNREYENAREDFRKGHIDEKEYIDYKKNIVSKYFRDIQQAKKLGLPVNAGLLFNTNIKLANGGSLGSVETAARGTIMRSTDPTKRPSPSVSATIYPAGYTMMGNDGNMWVIAEDSRGIHRWKKVTHEDGTEIAEDGKDISAKGEATSVKPNYVLRYETSEGAGKSDQKVIYSYDFIQKGKFICRAFIVVDNFEYQQDRPSYDDKFDYYRGEVYSVKTPGEYLAYPTTYHIESVYSEDGGSVELTKEEMAQLDNEIDAIFDYCLSKVEFSESSKCLITKEEMETALSSIKKAADGKYVTKKSLLTTIPLKKEEIWFTPEGMIGSEPKGSAQDFIQREWAKNYGATDMKLIGEDKKNYIYELIGDDNSINAATTRLQELGVDIETFGKTKRAYIPKTAMDSTSAHLRYPLLTPFADGGGVEIGKDFYSKEELQDIKFGIEKAYGQKFEEIDKERMFWQKVISGTRTQKEKMYNALLGVEAKNTGALQKMNNGGGVGETIDSISEQDFISNKEFMIGEVKLFLARLNNPTYYQVREYMLENGKWEKYATYGSPNWKDVVAEVKSVYENKAYAGQMKNGGGIGEEELPEDYLEHAFEVERNGRFYVYYGSSYFDIVSKEDFDTFPKDSSTRGYVNTKGEFVPEEIGNEGQLFKDGGGIGEEETIIHLGQTVDPKIYSAYMKYKGDKKTLTPLINNVKRALKNVETEEDIKKSVSYKRLKEALGIEAADGKQIEQMVYPISLEDAKRMYGHEVAWEIDEKDYKIINRLRNKWQKENLSREEHMREVKDALWKAAKAADGKQIEQADILTNSMLSIMDLYNYILANDNKITIHGSPYTYASHGSYNLRVKGGKGASYNIVPYFPEKRGMFEKANFYTLIRQNRGHNFAINEDGVLIDVAEDGTEIK